MINRSIQEQISVHLADRKAIIITGPRQVGKTTLLRSMFKGEDSLLWLNGDEPDIRLKLQNANTSQLKSLIGPHKTLVIDEAQRIENIGLTLKLIIDNLSDVKVIATGSSSFELANKINEPLTGRKWEMNLFGFSLEELTNHFGSLEEHRQLENRLIYGSYPDVINNPGKEEQVLSALADSYLYKDILAWNKVQKSDKLELLLQALAYQVGNQVSYTELGQITGLDNETVENYIRILEQAFIIFRLGPLSRNLRNELKKTRKIYFTDNGIRNAIIKQYNPIKLRNDVGALWENFVINERRKHLNNHQINVNAYFWRTHAQQEIDYIEERNGEMDAYEMKWNPSKKWKLPKSFGEAYNVRKQLIVSPENYREDIVADW
jgi:uncharacterized protein